MKNPKDDQESERIVNDFAEAAKPERALDNYPESSTTKTSFSIRRTIARILIAISFLIITGIAFIIWSVGGALGGGTRGEIALSGVILLTLIIIVHRYLWRYGRPKDKNEVRPVIKDHVNTEQWTKDDLEIEWHQNGRKKASGKYINGCYDGLWTWWDEQGNKVSEETYSEGVAEGTRICWYSNGQMESKANFINGIIEGKMIMWHNNGQKKSEENWKDGAVLSLKEWNENGDEIKN